MGLFSGIEDAQLQQQQPPRKDAKPVVPADLSDVLLVEDQEHSVTCGVCHGSEMATHITRVEINAGGAVTEVTADGTRMFLTKPAGRGVQTTIEFGCELCHGTTKLVFQFHKGTTLVSADKKESEGRGDDVEFPRTIWRD